MMTNWTALIAKGESQTLEFKKSFGKETIETICAMANADGGHVLIGVDDAGAMVGVQVGKKSMEDWANQIQSTLDPKLQPRMQELELDQLEDNQHIIEIRIEKSTTLPVSFNGRFLKRVGKTNQAMSVEEVAQKLMNTKLSWDSGIETRASIADLDRPSIDKFMKLRQEAGRREGSGKENWQKVLEKLYLVTEGKVTRAAMLLFGKTPQKFYSSSFLKVGRFKGLTEILDSRNIDGNLINQMDESMSWFKEKLSTEFKFGENATRELIWEFPLEAVREALANAICHRDYNSDSHIQIRLYDRRMEFRNPGGLPPDLKPADLLKEHSSVPRNRLIAGAFFECGYIEHWGTGTLRMADFLANSGHPRPVLDSSTLLFRAELRKGFTLEALADMGFNERQIKCFEHVSKVGRITNSEYQGLTAAIKRTASRELTELVEAGILQKNGTTGKGTFYSLA